MLAQTAKTCQERMEVYDSRIARGGGGEQLEKKRHLALMNASEVVVPRHVRDLLDPPDLERFQPRAVRVKVEGEIKREGDELGVLHLGVGRARDGAVQVEVDERGGSGFGKLGRSEGVEKAQTEAQTEARTEAQTKAEVGHGEGNGEKAQTTQTQEQKAKDPNAAGESVLD